MKFAVSHSERAFPIYIVGIHYHAPDGVNQIATIIVTEDDFTTYHDTTVPSIAYTKLCEAKGVNKGSLIVISYTVGYKNTQMFVV